jgi:hypothetical protein
MASLCLFWLQAVDATVSDMMSQMNIDIAFLSDLGKDKLFAIPEHAALASTIAKAYLADPSKNRKEMAAHSSVLSVLMKLSEARVSFGHCPVALACLPAMLDALAACAHISQSISADDAERCFDCLRQSLLEYVTYRRGPSVKAALKQDDMIAVNVLDPTAVTLGTDMLDKAYDAISAYRTEQAAVALTKLLSEVSDVNF